MAVDPNYQDGKFKDSSPSTANNGSPLKALDRNEQLALQEAVMDAAGFEYSGVADTPQNSQMFKAYKASLSNGANLLSNHNFIIASPDDSQPAPSATPTSYPPGYEIFSGVFANETTGITNLTYIDGRVSFSGGDFYMAVPNTGALENITEFVASVADFDGKPRTRGVSYALVGDEYRVTVGVDALEDESANETLLGSVKFEQGSVATGHEVGSLSVGNLSNYTDIAYKASGGNSAVENMITGTPIASGDGMIIECEFGTRFKRVSTTNGDITDFESVGDIYIRDWLSLDEGAAYASARDFANTQNKPLNMMDGYTWDLSSLAEPVPLPDYGVEGNFVANVDFISTRKRERRIQSNGVMDIEATGNTLTLSGGQYNTYENVIATAINIDGNASDYGFFWNSFSRSTGLISIDTGNGQSINQNFFHDHRGGIHIFGGDGSTQFEECDQNAFFGLDTTGYEIGADGWHVLNESYRNQNNVIYHAYMEGAGNKAIKGNFHTMRTYSDGSGSAYATPPTCHHLLQGDENVRNSNDHFSANPQANMAIGGLWDVLNADQDGQPLCFFETNVVQSVVQDDSIPMGFKYKYGGTSTIDFSSLRVRLSNSFSGRFGLTVLMQNVQGLLSLEVDNDGGQQTQSANIYHDLGNGFRLYRFSCNARNDGEDDQFRFFFRPVGGTAENYLVAAWATPQKTTFMPGPVPEQHIIGVSYSGGTPNSPTALPVGGRVQNRDASLTNGDTLEWVKITNGTLVSSITI
ncbi:intramolecular chaperone auto-processing domain protein [Vibrio phage vB_VhaS_MAG7]|nr:intramolecular chaperone auto-processing domain protein [Vibrio phage vB_VhaS_MAG7]